MIPELCSSYLGYLSETEQVSSVSPQIAELTMAVSTLPSMQIVIHDEGIVPYRASEGSVGYDISSPKTIRLIPG